MKVVYLPIFTISILFIYLICYFFFFVRLSSTYFSLLVLYLIVRHFVSFSLPSSLKPKLILYVYRGQPVALSWRRLNTIAPLPNIVDAWNHTHNNNIINNNNDIHNHLWKVNKLESCDNWIIFFFCCFIGKISNPK